MSKSWDEEEVELDKITQICSRRLEDEVNNTITQMDELHSFLELWETAIGKNNIQKIEVRRKSNGNV